MRVDLAFDESPKVNEKIATGVEVESRLIVARVKSRAETISRFLTIEKPRKM